ncbi:MAG: hypothetical protein Q8P23_03920 [bacterium]|nr:hypothetical protein [bacterium]
MKKFMNSMYTRFAPLVNARWFEVVMSLLIFANPVAIAPQVFVVFTTPSVEAISVPMWCIFSAIQTAFVFNGIKTKNFSVFASMLISLIESIAIIVTVYVRG